MTAPLSPQRLPLGAPRGSFRQALVVAGVLVAGGLAAMTLMVTVGLARADALLDRLSRSQDQLAEVTRIQADVNRLRADVATGEDPTSTLASVEVGLKVYDSSVRAEGRRLGQPERAQQVVEQANAARLAQHFATLRTALLDPVGGGSALEARRRFDALAGAIVARERREAAEAIEAMRALRRTITLLGLAIPSLVVLVGAVGGWVMLRSMLRPLRELEGAAERAGRGERAPPVRVAGFAEFRELAAAFNRMEGEITEQRAALRNANRDLEIQVQTRTAEIEASREALAEVDRTRRLFFDKVGHELRTPVTVILGEAEVALREAQTSPEQLRDALERVAANGAFLRRRLEDMLALARAEDGRIALRREPVDLGRVVREAAALAEPYVRASGLRLTADGPVDAGPVLEGDASWLQQALLALVDNATKFAGGGGAVGLTLETRTGRAVIRVCDSGPGVSADELPRLFDSYYQTSAGRGRGGSGLGLSIARWVVEQHGGEIRAQSPPGKGLIIEIELPVRP